MLSEAWEVGTMRGPLLRRGTEAQSGQLALEPVLFAALPSVRSHDLLTQKERHLNMRCFVGNFQLT